MKKMMANIIEDKKERQKADTHQNVKRHIPLVSLFLWRNMVFIQWMHRLTFSVVWRGGRQGKNWVVLNSFFCKGFKWLYTLLKFISINIIAAISWPPPLLSHLFSPRLFKATPFFTA